MGGALEMTSADLRMMNGSKPQATDFRRGAATRLVVPESNLPATRETETQRRPDPGTPKSQELTIRQITQIETLDWWANEIALSLLKQSRYPDWSMEEFAGLVIFARSRKLNLVAGQLHGVKRKGKICYQTGIDGFRLIAQRSKAYAGIDEPLFEDDSRDPRIPKKCVVTVYRIVQGIRCPFTASTWWADYYPGDGDAGFMWRQMPRVMLPKCTEAQACRKAFPEECSGIYVEEEMDQAGIVDVEIEAKPEREPIRQPQRKSRAEEVNAKAQGREDAKDCQSSDNLKDAGGTPALPGNPNGFSVGPEGEVDSNSYRVGLVVRVNEKKAKNDRMHYSACLRDENLEETWFNTWKESHKKECEQARDHAWPTCIHFKTSETGYREILGVEFKR
jgi:phage recombination protein Bet